ncbi:hypothetical protein OSB04_028254 [Centaurea solstitialis]|uniref:Uncharacterized protein n=1 Tax=Centaurea solstitialis TaxID=347529 RepID=A0AA38T082_9ASTR|nr:hypothetical protein OSB04_028254 [Centaurea solstitialis]
MAVFRRHQASYRRRRDGGGAWLSANQQQAEPWFRRLLLRLLSGGWLAAEHGGGGDLVTAAVPAVVVASAVAAVRLVFGRRVAAAVSTYICVYCMACMCAHGYWKREPHALGELWGPTRVQTDGRKGIHMPLVLARLRIRVKPQLDSGDRDSDGIDFFEMVSTRSQLRTGAVARDAVAFTVDQTWVEERNTVPQRPPGLSEGSVQMLKFHLCDPYPIVTKATLKAQIFDNVMRDVIKSMYTQKESFVKMLENRDASHRRRKVMRENAYNGFGNAEVVVVMEETRVIGEKKK